MPQIRFRVVLGAEATKHWIDLPRRRFERIHGHHVRGTTLDYINVVV